MYCPLSNHQIDDPIPITSKKALTLLDGYVIIKLGRPIRLDSLFEMGNYQDGLLKKELLRHE